MSGGEFFTDGKSFEHDVRDSLTHLRAKVADLATFVTYATSKALLVTTSGTPLASSSQLSSAISILNSIDSNDFATESTLFNIESALDVNLSTRASAAPMTSASNSLASLNSKDFATESTASSILTSLQSLDSKATTVTAIGSSTAAPLTVVLDTGDAQRTILGITFITDGADTIELQSSIDGITYDTVYTFTTTGAETRVITFDIASRYARLTSSTTTSKTFRMSAK